MSSSRVFPITSIYLQGQLSGIIQVFFLYGTHKYRILLYHEHTSLLRVEPPWVSTTPTKVPAVYGIFLNGKVNNSSDFSLTHSFRLHKFLNYINTVQSAFVMTSFGCFLKIVYHMFSTGCCGRLLEQLVS